MTSFLCQHKNYYNFIQHEIQISHTNSALPAMSISGLLGGLFDLVQIAPQTQARHTEPNMRNVKKERRNSHTKYCSHNRTHAHQCTRTFSSSFVCCRSIHCSVCLCLASVCASIQFQLFFLFSFARKLRPDPTTQVFHCDFFFSSSSQLYYHRFVNFCTECTTYLRAAVIGLLFIDLSSPTLRLRCSQKRSNSCQ